jgi:hypothetical protein
MADVAGRGFVPAGGNADKRLMDLRRGQTHRVIIRAMGCALGTLGDVPARQPVFQFGLGIHRQTRQLSRAFLGPPAHPPPFPPESHCGSLAGNRTALLLSDPVEETGNSATAWTVPAVVEGYGQIAARLS